MKNRFVAASFEGPAIFVERPGIFYVNVSDVTHDDWGMKAIITDFRMPGMARLQRSPCPIAAAWNVFGFDDGDWHALHIPWRSFFDFEVIRSCVAKARENAKTGSTVCWDDGQKIFAEYDLRLAAKYKNVMRKYKLG